MCCCRLGILHSMNTIPLLTIRKTSPPGDDSRLALELVCEFRHADGHDVGLPLDVGLQLEDGDVVLEGGRLVVLVDHHPLHLHTGRCRAGTGRT